MVHEQKKGRSVSFDEVFEDLHRFKRDGKLGAWVEPRAEATHAAFKRRMKEWYQSQSGSEVGSSTEPTLEEVNSLFIEVVGGPKKGRTYGLGSQYSSVQLNQVCVLLPVALLRIRKLWMHCNVK